jgi:y4mF family transcriptional regulator
LLNYIISNILMETDLIRYVKQMRKQLGLTQVDCAMKAGVGLMFLRDLEQGKKSLRMDKVNQVLQLFGTQLGVVRNNNKI